MPAFTPHAIRLASVYFPILVDCARNQQLITYGNLVARAKELYPHSEEVQSAIPTSSGQKLDVIRTFCRKRDLPDLASLVVNAKTGAPGESDPLRHIADELQQQAFAYDWDSQSTAFDAHIVEEAARATPLVKRKKPDAEHLLFQYYANNKADLPADIKQYREDILDLLIEGHEVADAFAMALQN
ncbi:hypothetical protein PQR75_00910 [Paraburkholderia fungorum]|uniref:hypothetical protein n=1 Tax=Paraburkholderia fungorum TaxID=134537 RepID=UPI0038B7CE41